MKAHMQFTKGFVSGAERDWTSYEKLDGDQVTVEGVEKISFGAGLVLERGELVFYYDDKFLVNFTIEPEGLRTKAKSEAAGLFVTLQDCDRCRLPDVLLPCSCATWCGNGLCLSEDGRETVDKGPRKAEFWDKEPEGAEGEDTEMPFRDNSGSHGSKGFI